MFNLKAQYGDLGVSDIIVLPIEGEGKLPEGWRIMREAEVLDQFDRVLQAVSGMPNNVNVKLHEDCVVLSNSSCYGRSLKPPQNRRLQSESKFIVRKKRSEEGSHSEKVNWVILTKIDAQNSEKRSRFQRLRLTFNEIIEYIRSLLVHIIGPHPAHMALSYIHFSTGTYVEQNSRWTRPMPYSWMPIRCFCMFIDFQAKRYATHETLGTLCRKTLGKFSYVNSTIREYAKTSEGFKHCLKLTLHPQDVIDPNFPIFKEEFRFHIMSKSISVLWFPSYGMLISANKGETEHFLKWTHYDCKLRDEECVTLNEDVYNSWRAKYGRLGDPGSFFIKK